MPKKKSKTGKPVKNVKKKRSAAKHSARKNKNRSDIVVEEEMTRVVPVTRTEVRAEPVTLARALGEAAVVEETTEPRVSRSVTRRRRRA